MLDRLNELVALLTKPPRAVKGKPKFDEERLLLQRRRERLVDAVADGALGPADVRKKLGEIDAAIGDVDVRKVQWEEEQKVARPEVRAEALRDARRMKKAWHGMTPADRRELIRMHAKRVEIVSRQKRRWERDAWEIVVTWKK